MTKHFSRRHFLQMSSVAVTYALAHDLLRQRRTQAQPIEETIVVIGAGMAGLAAARQLQNYGYQVIVLEGRERIGGRIWTDESLGVALDLGAAWIHGIEGNPIFELAQYWRIETSLTDFEASALYFGNREFSDEEYVQIETVFDEISDELQTLKETLDDDLSVGEAVDRLLADYDDLSERVRAGARWVFEAEIGLEMGENLENLSLLALGEDEEFAGDDVVFPGGYGELVERLADGLDIRVNQIVTGIYHDDEGVEIETTDGTFEGDRVIVTLPLGVLKSGDVEFDPPLPDAKQAALDRMAMGTLDKVALRFPALFWPKALHSFGAADPPLDEPTEFWNMAIHTGEPILVALIGGDDARQLEAQDEQRVIERLMRHLRGIFGDKIPEPAAFIITRWNMDKFSYGAYAHIPPDADIADYETIAEPTGDRVFFAGEATHIKYPGTVHGAFLSGQREAERVINGF